ncbi:MAG TPA: acyl-CoA carboxylase subunit beta, partial [Mycobacterium sp.]
MVDVLPDRVDTRAPVYLENREGLIAQLDAIAEQLALANGGGGEKYVARHRRRGKMLARERVELLLDPDTAFLELCPFAAWGSKFP